MVQAKARAQAPAGPLPAHVVGTAGHIDHGKSRLVLALTGTDPDRLPEEKARGITIDLGFAAMRLADGRRVAFVDVPGHERFVRTMVAGASGIDLALVVVAADEGPMPQTVEHLAILDLLGVRQGIVALTKVDLVDREWRDLVSGEVEALLAGSGLAGAPVIPVSALTGEGLGDLRAVLAERLAALAPRTLEGPARLPVDRVFTRPGFGTVVTGTLAAGRIRREDRLTLYPAGREVRVRGVEVHGQARDEALAGERTALNLAGVGREAVARGDVVAAPGAVQVTRTLAADVRLLPTAPALRSGRTVHVHAGTAQSTGRLVWLDADSVDGQRSPDALPAPARIHLRHAMALHNGDRFIVRAGTPLGTIGGGTVLDPHGEAYRRRRTASLQALDAMRGDATTALVLAALAQAAGAPQTTAELGAATGLGEEVLDRALTRLAEAGRVVEPPGGGHLTAQGWQAIEGAVLAAIGAYHEAHPLRPGAPREEVRRQAAARLDGRRFGLVVAAWQAAGLLTAERDRLALASFRPGEGAAAAAIDAVAQRLRQGGLGGLGAEEAVVGVADGAEILALLVARGQAVRLPEGLVLHADAVAEARAALEAMLARDGAVGAAAYRDALGVSRRVAVPLLEHFDALRVTRRQGDLHVALGPARTGPS